MDSFCRSFSCTHSQDNGSCSCNGIAAGKYAVFRCLSSLFICNDTFSLVDVKTHRRRRDQRVRGSTESHDDRIYINIKFRTRDFNRTSSSRCIRLAKLHADTFDAAYIVILTGRGAFASAYDVMNNWGANHGAISYGHIGADLITLCSMLRIPVSMHNVEEKEIFRPAAWNAFGMDKEGQDYRACANFGPLYKK